ncbi:phospholipase D1 [Caerostris darwini]|uniref:Phospholipase n=1 Tax=Caerostris darwini TaxID=1538125 RepID=A0AAV4TUP8_9ARAC|nr:phospholipase D1 [Caerostris darwini]
MSDEEEPLLADDVAESSTDESASYGCRGQGDSNKVQLKDNDESLITFAVGLKSMPYSRIRDQFLPFDDPLLKRLIPGCEVELSIQDAQYKDKRCWLERDHSTRRSSMVLHINKVPKVPTFPLTTDEVKRRKDITWKMAALESYLQNVLDISKFRNFSETLEFLEIGPLSFIEELGPKSKEGFVSRRCNYRDTPLGYCGQFCGMHVCPFWKKRWLFIKEHFVGMMDPRRGQVDCILLFDRRFKVDSRKRKTRLKNGILIQNLSKYRIDRILFTVLKLLLKCESDHQAESWVIEFNFMLDRGSKDFVRPNRYGSFAPPRPLTECRWIVDGATYFEAVAEVLDKAKEEIFIADWWLTPEIYLKRPTVHGHYWQLDYLLQRKAREGVQIYVLLYKEIELALGINSYHTKKKLIKMHKNIKVIRHPEVSKGVYLWAHHEKIVCVDQTYAFVGGLDLCYGRWDDYQHRLSDFGDVEERLKILRHMSVFRRDSEVPKEARSTSSVPDLSSDAEMVKPQEMVEDAEGKPGRLKTAIRKFQATRTFKEVKKKLSREAEMDQLQSSNQKLLSNLQPADRRRTIQEMALLVLGMNRKFRLWYGKDYVNFISKDFQNLQEPYSDFIDRDVTPRMPWHDVGLFIQGRIARDVARHFILRWNHAKAEIYPRNISYPYLMPKSYNSLGDNVPPILSDTIGTIFRAECQNQFFITQPSDEDNVFNGIADALCNRILRAYRNKTPFHVYVVIPLLPAFEGELGTGSGTCIQAITYWNYKSICRGPTSLYSRLSRHIRDPSVYISFCGLRTHGSLNKKLVTELVYVHSKLLIADDQVAIIGSANINDRSLLGKRDSEIAVVVRDTHFLAEEIGRPHEAGKFCHSLRNAIFREHLGLMASNKFANELLDPSSLVFSKGVWMETAINNTEIYEDVFHCVPTDKAHSFPELRMLQLEPCLADTNPEQAKKN